MQNKTQQTDDRQMVRKRQQESAGPQTMSGYVNAANAPMISRMPGNGGAQLRRAALTQMQQTQGNGFVQRFLANNQLQREPDDQQAAPTHIGANGANLEANGTIKGEAPMVEFNAGMFKVNGVLQADTVIATNVVGSNYTPGAGNIW